MLEKEVAPVPAQPRSSLAVTAPGANSGAATKVLIRGLRRPDNFNDVGEAKTGSFSPELVAATLHKWASKQGWRPLTPGPKDNLLRAASTKAATTGMLADIAGVQKVAFTESMYSGGTGGGHVVYTSYLPPFKVPSLAAPKKKQASTASVMVEELAKLCTSPVAQLSQSSRIGKTPAQFSNKGLSVGQLSRPDGFGKTAPGCATASV